jgi:hypothetical protein
MEWYISNIDNSETVFNIPFPNESKELSVFIDGYILPRSEYFETYKNETEEELVRKLYSKFGNQFINYIKGSFILVLRKDKNIQVYTDRHASVKCFYFETDNEFIISNSLKQIRRFIELKISQENSAIFTLFNHFIGDLTLYREVFQLKSAGAIYVKDNKLEVTNYWKPQFLFQKKDKLHRADVLAIEWNKIIQGYHSYLKPNKTALTLTGGNDSRMILSALLANDITPVNMTFGNPKSGDVIVAEKICSTLNLAFKNYHVENPASDWFTLVADNVIIPRGNSLVNIHRAHRIDAVKKLKDDNPKVEMLYTGLVGGEYIKRPSYNNVTIPEIYQRWIDFRNSKGKKEFIIIQLQNKGIKTVTLNIDYIISELDRIIIPEGDFNPDEIKFIHLHQYYAVTHHTQDPTLFRNSIKFIINPYMDIDFLESLSKSKEWYLNKKGSGPMEKVWHSYLQVKITHLLCPKLSYIPFAKNGEYTGLEMLKSPLKYLLKRGWKRLRKNSTLYERNFAMGSWIYDFSKSQLNEMEHKVSDLYEKDYLKQVLEKIKNKKSEEDWHTITAAINLNMNYNFFKKNK